MSVVKTDYSEDVVELLETFYVPTDQPEGGDESYAWTLSEIHEQVISVLPSRWISQEVVHEALKKLGYVPKLHRTELGPMGLRYSAKLNTNEKNWKL